MKGIAAASLSFIASRTQDRDYIEDFVKLKIKETMDVSSPSELKFAFDQNKSLVDDFDDPLISVAKDYINEDNSDVQKIRSNIETHMYYFDNKWLMNYLQKEHPPYYSIIKTDTKSEEFETWLALQVKGFLRWIQNMLINENR